jgi:hypothetical protein
MKKVVFTTTLKAIRAKNPCADGWAKLLAHLGKKKADDEPLNLLTILESNGAQDMLWALQCVEHTELERITRLMAADFAEAVSHLYEKEYPDDKRPRLAIKAARDFANGKITAQERAAAWAAGDAAWAAAWAAGDAARAAGDAARAATRAAAWDAAWAAGDAQAKIIRKYLGK